MAARSRRLYRAQNAIWLWLGLAAIVSLAGWLIAPEDEATRSAIGRQLSSGLDDLWHYFLGFGGAAVTFGVWTLRVRAEMIGHLFVAVSVMLNAIAVTAVTGLVASAFILYGVALASGFRVWFLVQVAHDRH